MKQSYSKHGVTDLFKQLLVKLGATDSSLHGMTLLITSPDKQSGKTFVATNLANQAGAIGLTTLLIDFNFNNPVISHIYNLPSNSTVNQLDNYQTTDEILNTACQTVTDNLSILTFKDGPFSSKSYLYSDKIQELLQRLSGSFDLIIIDSAPVTESSITVKISSIISKNLLVIRQGKDKKAPSLRALQLLNTLNSGSVHYILNDYREEYDI